MAWTVLSVATRALVDACERLGLDGDALLSEAGLARADILDPEARVPAAQSDQLWTAAVARSGDPLLALHAAEALPPGAYRVLHYLGANAPTLGSALERLVRYFPLVDPRVAWHIEPEPDGGRALRMTIPGLAGGVPRWPAEYTLTATLLQLRAASGVVWAPRLVEMQHASTPEFAAEHRRVFGAPVRYGANRTALVVSAATWSHPVPRADGALFALLDRHALALVDELPREAGLPERVRAAVAERLRAGEATDMAALARGLGFGKRTLQRRLADEGASFAALVDEIRAASARALLADRGVALSEVAFLLGFSDQSAFTRAYRRWTGEPPAAARIRPLSRRGGGSRPAR